MELHQLRYFVAAAEAGSMSRAAERCRVAQPSLSQQIKKLERSVGAALFDRLGRGVALTEAGRALLPRARRILAEVRDAEANLRRDLDEGRGSVSIGAIPTMAPYLLPGALDALRAEFPECDITIREDLTEHLAAALAENELDLALVSTPADHELIDLEVIGHEELVFAVGPDHPLGSAGELGIADLRGQPTVMLEEVHCLGKQIQWFCASRHVQPRVVCRTTQMATVFELVGRGLGVSAVPEMAAAAHRPGRCRFLRLKQNKPVRQIAVARRRDRSRPRLAARFAELVAENLRRGAHRLPARG